MTKRKADDDDDDEFSDDDDSIEIEEEEEEDDDDNNDDDDIAPAPTKKAATQQKKTLRKQQNENKMKSEAPPPKKNSASDPSAKLESNHSSFASIKLTQGDNGLYLDLPGKKRITVRAFRGKVGVDIREYYEKNGELLPGKKGIWLTRDQYMTMSSAMQAINEAVERFD